MIKHACISKFFRVSLLALFFVLPACETSEDDEVNSFQYKSSLVQFSNCDELSGYLIKSAEQQEKLYRYHDTLAGTPGFDERINVAEDLDLTSGAGGAVAEKNSATIDDYSSTNNQHAGVDEADFIKTDGEYSYIVTGGYFVIFDNWPAAESKELARIRLKGNPIALFVYNDIVWIVSNIVDYQFIENDEKSLTEFAPRISQLSSVSIYDVTERRAPELIREITMEGYYLDARRIANNVHMVSSAHIDIQPLLQTDLVADISDLLPVLTDKIYQANHNVSTATSLISECGNIYRPGTANGTATISLLSFDLDNPRAETSRQTIISNPGAVYANKQSLYIATVENNYWAWLPVLEGEEKPTPGTTFHKFSLDNKPVYAASGRVDGYIINQFAMDEYNDLLRTVTTVDTWWNNDDPVNSLFILQQSGKALILRSKLTGLGKPGERIYAARFMGDKGFLVTFEQIDPLYTLDLKDPDNPLIAGELEVPGFSTYLHPIGEGLLLAIGRDTENNTVKLSLFDTSNFAHPALLHSESIRAGSHSMAEYEHKAFTWYANEKLLAIPVTRWGRDSRAFGGYDLFTGLKLFKVDKHQGFELFGEIDHNVFFKNESENRWYYPKNIKRSFFVSSSEDKSYLYSISNRGMKVNAVADIKTDLAVLPLPVYDRGDVTMLFE